MATDGFQMYKNVGIMYKTISNYGDQTVVEVENNKNDLKNRLILLLNPTVALLCCSRSTAPFHFLILRPRKRLLSLAGALSTSLRADCLSSWFDIQFCTCDSVRGVATVIIWVFEIHKLSRQADQVPHPDLGDGELRRLRCGILQLYLFLLPRLNDRVNVGFSDVGRAAFVRHLASFTFAITTEARGCFFFRHDCVDVLIMCKSASEVYYSFKKRKLNSIYLKTRWHSNQRKGGMKAVKRIW